MLKICNKDDLQIETQWSRVEAFTDDVLALIDAHRDPSIVPKASTPQIHGPGSNSATLMPFKVVMCSHCHQLGHNSKFSHLFICTAISRHPAELNKQWPEYPHAPPPGKENIALSWSLAQLSLVMSVLSLYAPKLVILHLSRAFQQNDPSGWTIMSRQCERLRAHSHIPVLTGIGPFRTMHVIVII